MTEKFDPYYTWLGIPPEDQPADYYRLLGLKPFEGNREVISHAADQRMGHVRSFQNGKRAEFSQKLLNELSRAAGCLLNPAEKVAYDRKIQKRLGSAPEASDKPQAAVPSTTRIAAPAPKKTLAQAKPLQRSPSAPRWAGESDAPSPPIAPIPVKPADTPASPIAPIRIESRTPSAALIDKRPIPNWLIFGGLGATLIVVLVVVLLRSDSRGPANNLDSVVADDKSPNSESTAHETATTVSDNALDSAQATAAPITASTSAASDKPATSGVAQDGTKSPATSPNNITEPAVAPDSPASIATDFPEDADVVRLTGFDGVEISDSRHVVDFDSPFTIEMWARLLPNRQMHWLAGNLVFLPPERPGEDAITAGWQWWISEPTVNSWKMSITTKVGFYVNVPIEADRWHHFVACSDGDHLSFFIDGKLAGTRPVQLLKDGWTESPLKVSLSSHSRMNSMQSGGMNADLRWFRVSSTCRYTTNFTPEVAFASDTDTSVLLDCRNMQGAVIADLSGHGREGRLRGGTRLVAKEFPSSDQIASATVEPAVPGDDVPETMPVVTSEPVPSVEPVPASTVPSRLPIPADAQLREAVAKVRDVFAADWDALKDASDKATLGQKLLNTARESRDDAVARYALLDQARLLALQSGRLPLAFVVADEMSQTFDTDSLALKVDLLKQASANTKTPTDPKQLVQSSLEVTENAIISGNFDSAQEAARIALASATKLNDSSLKILARTRRDEIPILKRNWEIAHDAKAQLAESPDAPRLNHVWGRFLALQQRDWQEAAKSLARSDDETWLAIGTMESESPRDPAVQQALADKIWSAAESASRRDKDSLLLRARHWYSLAQPRLQGLEQAHVDKRIQEIDEQLPLDLVSQASGTSLAAQSPVAALPPGAEPPRQFMGLLGRIQNQEMDAGMLLRYQNGFVISNDRLTEIFAQARQPRGALQIEFAGLLHVPAAMTVTLRQLGGSEMGGIHSLYLNGRKLGEVGGVNRTKDDTYKVELAAGEHAIRWKLTGGDLGRAAILISDAATGQPLTLYHTAAMLNASRVAPTRLNIDMVNN